MSQHTALSPVDPAASPHGAEAPSRSASFAARLRDATKLVHREAERTGFIADLIRGRATREGYAAYLRNLAPVYANLERRLEAIARPGPLLAAFADPGLWRLPALGADLVALAGPDWARTCPLMPEAEAYADAIAAADEPRLAAHAYARYLGDLSGGQILRPLLARSLGLGPESLGLYAFPMISDVELPKRAMRDALDTVPPESATADAIVGEAIAAFRHNIAMSTALSDALRPVPG